MGAVSAGITSGSRLLDREDSLAIALVSSACVAAARRSMAGQALEDFDRQALQRAAELFEGALDGLRFIRSSGKQGRPPSQLSYSGFAVQLLNENPKILSHGTNGLAAAQDLMADLETWLHRIEEFASTGKATDAAEFADFFLALTELSRAEAGSTGEVTNPPTPT
jgi:hypothetical protein